METIFIAIFCIALILFGAMTISQNALSTTDTVAVAFKEMEDTSGNISRTNISSLGATTSDGITIDMTLENAGETQLEDFDEWDVILQYYDTDDNYLIKRLTYTSGTPPGNDEWQVKGIYLSVSSGTPEAFDIGIFNPDEEMKIRMKVDPVLGTPNANRVIVVTPNGITASAIFTR